MGMFIWLVVACAMALIEVFTLTLVTVWLVVGGLAAFVAAFLGASITVQIAEGVKEVRTDDCWSIDLPRDAAIFKALDWCREGDLLALSGKGPEPYLEINGVKHPYSDRGTVEEWARRKGLQIL